MAARQCNLVAVRSLPDRCRMVLDAGCEEAAPECPLELVDLPAGTLCTIFALLPPAHRARCACVCSQWRELLAGPSLWRELVLGEADATCLAGAAARGEGQLRQLRVVASMTLRLWTELEEAVRRNADSLLHVVTGMLLAQALVFPQAETLLSLLNGDASLWTCIYTSAAHAGRLLARTEPPLCRLRLLALFVDGWEENDRRLHAFFSQLVGGTHLRRLGILDSPLGDDPAALASLPASLPASLESLELTRCALRAPEALPALTSLLSLPLRELAIDNGGGEAAAATAARASLFHAASPDAMAAACLAARSSSTLRSLSLVGCGLWHNGAPSGRAPSWPGVQLIAALTGHASLVTLCLDDNECRSHAERCAAGAALASLASARGGALRSLSVARSSLRDFGCGPLVDALARGACELSELTVSANGLGSRFVELRLVPALRAAASLRKLGCTYDWGNAFVELEEAAAELGGRASGNAGARERSDLSE